MKLIKPLPTIFLILLAIRGFYVPESVRATVLVGEVAGSGKTRINYFMNHDYISRDKPYLFDFAANALDRVREKLVKEGKMSDDWVVWEIPATELGITSDKTILEKKQSCQLSYGEVGGTYPPPELKNCYFIYYRGSFDYPGLLASLLALPQLTNVTPINTVDDFNDLREGSNEAWQAYAGGIYYSRPLWSPDSKYVAIGKWRDGLFSYEIYDVEQEIYIQLDLLKNGVAVEPIWYPTGRYFVYASLDEVYIYDVITREVKSTDLSTLTTVPINELLLSYDIQKNTILFAFDQGYFSDYHVYDIDLDTYLTRLRGRDVDYSLVLSWRIKPDNSRRELASPDGRFKAIVTHTNEGSTKEVVGLIPDNFQPLSKLEPAASSSITSDNHYALWIILGIGGSICIFLTGWFLRGRFELNKHTQSPGIG